ncbi:DNA mismatch repair protein MutL [Seiridium cupressi]
MATIKAIEARTVHQIQSGQVIVDLCSVVKELVENSVDAGTTNIEVRFKNQGLDSIEVQDNGGGITPENYETLALKHYTSKLSTYEDLTSLETFGFRGEALSSLCALSKFSVITCLASDAPKGSRLEFETSGKLRGTSVVAAQKGTTVSVEGLFNNLPVRRRELERNIKREWNKVISLLNQYACILTGVKFSVSQQPNKGKKIVLFSTKGNPTTRDNIINVFGAKTLTVLIPLELELELEPTGTPGQRWSKQEDASVKEVTIRGHVSRPAHGEGRQTPDRQMFFVNGRPCGLPQFAKVFNEVYKSYNSSQSPFIFADIQLDTHMYDVNVSPDKRTILLHDQTRLLDNLRESLIALFETQDYTVPQSQLGGPKQTPLKKLAVSRQNTADSENRGTRSPSVSVKDNGLGGSSLLEENSTPLKQDQNLIDKVAETPQQKHGISGQSRPQSGQGLNLISRWVERKANGSENTDAEIISPALDEPEGGISRSKERLVNKITLEDQRSEESAVDEPPRAIPQVPRRVVDFNARLDALSRGKTSTETVEIERENLEEPEPPIPSISTPSRVSEIKNVGWSSPKVKRTAPEFATITIDDETVTTLIGSPAKKARTQKSSTQTQQQKQLTSKSTAPIPSFQGRLTQMFSASSASRNKSEDADIATELVDGPNRTRSSSETSDKSEGLFVTEDQLAGDEIASRSPTEGSGSVCDIRQTTTSPHSPISRAGSQAGEDHGASEAGVSDAGHSHHTDEDYVHDEEKKVHEESKVQEMIDAVEDAARVTSEETQKRQQSFIKGTTRRKDAICQLLQKACLDTSRLRSAVSSLEDTLTKSMVDTDTSFSGDGLEGEDAEAKLSLTISKSDFSKMKIVGQFNLGFILAVRPAETNPDDLEDRHAMDDELFIVDQHATDEKYNFERLQATTVVQSQRLVQPKALELTAIEEEVIKENIDALEHNGFQVIIDESGYQPVGSRCQLLSLPLSRETTFTLADLEELISLLTDHQSASANTIPRPSKVRKMFAMRACRSSVMIGKSLTNKQMEKLVRHMGELDKPWNCPHGRPTMRHLCGLGAWNQSNWQEGDGLDGEQGAPTSWAAYLREKREE